jgi:hypothetical protein
MCSFSPVLACNLSLTSVDAFHCYHYLHITHFNIYCVLVNEYKICFLTSKILPDFTTTTTTTTTTIIIIIIITCIYAVLCL